MPVMMSGEEFVRGYEELYGVVVHTSERDALVRLLDQAPVKEVMLFNLFLGMARGRFGSKIHVRASCDRDQFVIYVGTHDREGVQYFRDKLRSDFDYPEVRRIMILPEPPR